MNDDSATGLGASFYFKLAGVALVFGVACFVVAMLMFKALVAFGVLAAFALLGAVALGAAWLTDRRRARRSY
jgi:Flp pilus assembly protein TadB